MGPLSPALPGSLLVAVVPADISAARAWPCCDPLRAATKLAGWAPCACCVGRWGSWGGQQPWGWDPFQRVFLSPTGRPGHRQAGYHKLFLFQTGQLEPLLSRFTEEEDLQMKRMLQRMDVLAKVRGC